MYRPSARSLLHWALVKMPNGGSAIVDIRKLLDYCLNPQHLRGRHKARVFAAVGIRQADAESLRAALLVAARDGEIQIGTQTKFGQRYAIDFDWDGAARVVRIRSSWIVRIGEQIPRLTTCFILPEKVRPWPV